MEKINAVLYSGKGFECPDEECQKWLINYGKKAERLFWEKTIKELRRKYDSPDSDDEISSAVWNALSILLEKNEERKNE